MERQFLWGGPEPKPSPAKFVTRSTSWWEQYAATLKMGTGAITELQRTSRDIVSLLPDPQQWNDAPRPFRGLAVGAVQSGKTSSMAGVTSVAFDQGFKIAIVLAGTKDDLRQQTARRFNTQLVRQRDEVDGIQGAFTLPANVKNRPLGGIALPYSVDIHQWAPGFIRVREALKKSEPCLFVIKKNTASLNSMRAILARAYDEFGFENLPTLVLDDECDDASVDRDGAPIPEAIGNLWRQKKMPPVAYVGYTATAAANLLQAPENDLYPEHFVYLLRYPAESSTPLTVAEQNPDQWYSGSQCYYEAFGDQAGLSENFLMDASVTVQDLLAPIPDKISMKEAIRAHIVSGAYRLALQPGASFSDPRNLPAPHSMLVQTSAMLDEHQRTIRGLAEMFSSTVGDDGSLKFDAAAISADMDAKPNDWHRWYRDFSETRERVYLERPSVRPHPFVTWNQVKERIPEVVKNLVVKAVNSDPKRGGELDYAPRLMGDGTTLPPQDVYVVVVGGAKLSRGITVEGLCTTYFTRWTPNPTEDTVLQISRWFGYRGTHLEFCRVFTTPEVCDALTEIHLNDHDLRIQLSQLMAKGETPRKAGLVLKCSARGLPTAKIGSGKIFDVSFSPYQTVFKFVEIGEFSVANRIAAVELAAAVRDREPEVVQTQAGTDRGLISRAWTALEVAAALESLQYSMHNPSLAGNPGGEFHRNADPSRPTSSSFPYRSDPYQVAAYLREWTDLASRGMTMPPPLFDVGLAYGQISSGTGPFDYPLLDRSISNSGKLLGDWTGRSAAWRGDALFDGPDERLLAAGSTMRGVGLRGLLLLYVIHRDGTGRQGAGVRREEHTPTFGISIPGGGPDLRRVTVSPN